MHEKSTKKRLEQFSKSQAALETMGNAIPKQGLNGAIPYG
jgi:hypothetical protein